MESIWRKQRLVLLVCLSASAVGIFPLTTSAQDTGRVEEPAPRSDLLRFDITELFLEFESSYDYRRVRSSRAGRFDQTQINEDLQVYERLGLSFDGYLLDRNLLEWQGRFEIGLDQSKFREDADLGTLEESDNGLLVRYDLSLTAFREKPISISARALRSRDRIARRFLPSLREERNEFGVSVFGTIGSGTLDMGFDFSDLKRTGNRREIDDERRRTSRFYIDGRWQESDRQKLRLFFDLQREESEFQGSSVDFDSRRNELRLEHELTFGPDGRHRFDTFARFNQEAGDLARDEFEIVPRLTFQHDERLQTTWRYGFYRLDQDAFGLQRHKADVQAIYRADENWRFSGDLFWLIERIENDVETTEFGGSLDVDYRRETPLGELTANLFLAADRERTLGSAGDRVVRGESHQIDTVRPVFLEQLNIELPTIVAYDANRTRIFVNGLDYFLIPVGRRVQVQRVLSGRIGPDEIVRFDYSYRVPSGSRVDTYRVDFLIEHAFNFGLTPYYGLEFRRQFASESIGTLALRDNMERHRFGARFEKPTWSVKAEAELFNDTNQPYDAYHVSGRAALLRNQTHSLDASAQFSRYSFTGDFDRRNVWWFSADVTDRVTINENLSATLGAAYRFENDSVDGDTDAVDLRCGLRLLRGYLDVDLLAEYDLLSIADNRDAGYGFWITIRRDLSHLLPTRTGVR